MKGNQLKQGGHQRFFLRPVILRHNSNVGQERILLLGAFSKLDDAYLCPVLIEDESKSFGEPLLFEFEDEFSRNDLYKIILP